MAEPEASDGAPEVPETSTLQTPVGTTRTRALPEVSELHPALRGIVVGSAGADLLLRTALASAVSVTALPWALSAAAREERELLGFYRELAEARDVTASFPRPPRGIEVTASAPSHRTFQAIGGRVETLRFESPFTPLNPALRERYGALEFNRTAWAQYWRHDGAPRPTLGVIHGFGASPYWLNSAFFSLPRLYESGYNLLLYTLPFHGARRNRRVPLDGSGYFAYGVAHLNEAVGQAIHDFRVFVDYLEESGVEQIGVTGLSLGGYTSAILAAVEARLQVVIPNAPVTNIGRLIRQWFPANVLLALASRARGVPRRELDDALAVHCPMTYEPVVPTERLMIIGGLGDRLAPPSQARELWEHWDRPRLHWYPGNHTLHVNRGAYLTEIRRFMEGVGFAP